MKVKSKKRPMSCTRLCCWRGGQGCVRPYPGSRTSAIRQQGEQRDSTTAGHVSDRLPRPRMSLAATTSPPNSPCPSQTLFFGHHWQRLSPLSVPYRCARTIRGRDADTRHSDDGHSSWRRSPNTSARRHELLSRARPCGRPPPQAAQATQLRQIADTINSCNQDVDKTDRAATVLDDSHQSRQGEK